jgi:hypothetical protein
VDLHLPPAVPLSRGEAHEDLLPANLSNCQAQSLEHPHRPLLSLAPPAAPDHSDSGTGHSLGRSTHPRDEISHRGGEESEQRVQQF